jgi:hypothetical protein
MWDSGLQEEGTMGEGGVLTLRGTQGKDAPGHGETMRQKETG